MKKLFLISLLLGLFIVAQGEDFGWDKEYTFSDYASPEMLGNGALGFGTAWGVDQVATKFGLKGGWNKFLQFGVATTQNYLVNARFQRFHDVEGASIPEMAINQAGQAIYTFLIDKPEGTQPGTYLTPKGNGLALIIKF